MDWLRGSLVLCENENGGGSESGGGGRTVERASWAKTLKSSQWLPSKARTSTTPRPAQISQDHLESGRVVKAKQGKSQDLSTGTKTWILREKLAKSDSEAEWRAYADQLDILDGNHYWKFDEESEHCDMKLLRRRLNALKHANNDSNMDDMLSSIRDSLKRDLGGMCNPRLYQHCYVGTKHLIDEYTEVVKYTIERLVKYCDATPDVCHDYLEAMKQARQSFGSSALMLSGGGTLGMCHIGVVKALLEQGLLPKVVCGSSAGSIVGAVLCTQRPNAVLPKLDELCNGDMRVFQGEDEWQGPPGMIVNILKGDPAFRINNLCRVMRALLGDITFREAYNHTGMALNIHVSSQDKHNLPRLLNYITTPNVVVWTAVASSCALPYVFEAPGLKAKDPETGEIEPWGHQDYRYIDGSIEGDLPAHILERLFNVNNFIASQVNPHVTSVLRAEGKDPNLYRRLADMSHDQLVKSLGMLLDYGVEWAPIKMAYSVMAQKYDGDVTILPTQNWTGYSWLDILANPSAKFMADAVKQGELAAWPKLDRIRNMVAIELALDGAINEVKAIMISNRKDPRTKIRRVPSSTRSERGFSRKRTKSIGSASLKAVPRIVRGRQTPHLPVKSMIEPSTITSATPAPVVNLLAGEHHHFGISSSDETHTSGRSSPPTPYDDDDFNDVRDGSTPRSRMDIDEADARIRAFLSQPVSPSMTFKSFWGLEAAVSNPLPPAEPASPELKRVLNGLQMSSIADRANDTRDRDAARRKKR